MASALARPGINGENAAAVHARVAWLDARAVQPALDLLPTAMQGRAATAQVLTIALQESRIVTRVQRTNAGVPGPARGYWQFERGGGCVEVVHNGRVYPYTKLLCQQARVDLRPAAIWEAISREDVQTDVLAAGLARLLLWLDPAPLPLRTDALGPDAGWQLYLRRWRPGKPHPKTWGGWFGAAWDYVEKPTGQTISSS